MRVCTQQGSYLLFEALTALASKKINVLNVLPLPEHYKMTNVYPQPDVFSEKSSRRYDTFGKKQPSCNTEWEQNHLACLNFWLPKQEQASNIVYKFRNMWHPEQGGLICRASKQLSLRETHVEISKVGMSIYILTCANIVHRVLFILCFLYQPLPAILYIQCDPKYGTIFLMV